MELFFRISIIAMLVVTIIKIIISFIDEDGEAAFSMIIGIIAAIFMVFVIVVAFKLKVPWYNIVLLFGSEICFICSIIPMEVERKDLWFGIVNALFLAFVVALTFLA